MRIVDTSAALLALGLMGCLGVSPEERAERALGGDEYGEDDDGDELHRPGQPCLVCHGEDHSPGDDVFMVAGTVYETPTSPLGLGGVTIEITDDEGRVETVMSNSAGNFMFKRGDGESEKAGLKKVPFEIAFPIKVRIYLDDVRQQVMESVSWREGSCAHCHALEGPLAESEPRVYLVGP